MKKHGTIRNMLLSAVLIAGAAWWYFTRSGEEAKIRGTLERMCRIVAKTPGENAAAGALKISRTDEVFAEPARLRFGHEMFDREFTPRELTALLARARQMLKSMKLELEDVKIVRHDGRAEISFSATFTGSAADRAGGDIHEVRDLIGLLRRDPDSGRWLIEELKVHEVLER